MRGSLLAASLESLRQFGYYDRYLQALDPSWREEVVFCLASSWLPVELALAHYAAHERLELPMSELAALGEWVSDRVAGAFLGSLLRSGRTQGMEPCPWLPLREYRRLCDRLVQGGSVTMHPTADKEALLELRGMPMLRHASFRQTMLALTRQAVGPFVFRAFVRELAGDAEGMRVQVRWL